MGRLSVLFFVAAVASFLAFAGAETKDYSLKLFTIATEETEGFIRFQKSAKYYGYDIEVCGMNEKWLGGDLAAGPGGGHKIKLLIRCMKKYKKEKNILALFTDSYDVVLNQDPEYVIKKYKALNSTVVFSAEDLIWPDASLASQYPHSDGYKYLCSGGYMGPVADIFQLLTLGDIRNKDDDQLYFTKIFLQDREKFGIMLDSEAVIFQNLNGNEDDVEVNFEIATRPKVQNKRFDTYPAIIHGNGPSKLYLDNLANYIPDGWSPTEGCIRCSEDSFSLSEIEKEDWPFVLIGLFVDEPQPFVRDYLKFISDLDYPKHKIDIFLHSHDQHHDEDIDPWVKEFEHTYRSFTYKTPKSFLTPDDARTLGMFHCKNVNCGYYFSVDADVSLTNPRTLQLLIEQNRTYISPILSKRGKLWSNFWGALSSEGFYKRSHDYTDIVYRERLGVWNVPYTASCYLIKSHVMRKMVHDPFYSPVADSDMVLAENNRKKGIFMYATNLHQFGHLKEKESYNQNKKHGDLFEVFDNQWDWENRYLNPEYNAHLRGEVPKEQPCPDVYWFPLVTENWAREMIEECEHYGHWSGGKHEDERLEGGYENVPTVDIHMSQLGYERHWLQILKSYVKPMNSAIFTGYYSDSIAHMNFVVKYQPTGQTFLRPHHDASTFTINMALNRRGIDYEGGGARFTRYNCSVSDTKVGWALMHPGRLTHQHEGLPTTKGTRYIMVSFIDP